MGREIARRRPPRRDWVRLQPAWLAHWERQQDGERHDRHEQEALAAAIRAVAVSLLNLAEAISRPR
jgi:hypothetical protein